MNEKIQTFIRDEKDIAKYRLDMLSASSGREYSDRLILLEKNFLSYPFSDLSLSSVEEARKALNMYRVDRSLFASRYEAVKSGGSVKLATNRQVSSIKRKIKHIDYVYRNIIEEDIHSINLISDPYFFKKYNAENTLASFDDLRQREGAISSKDRARVQIILCSFARFLFSELKEVRSGLERAGLSNKDFLAYKIRLDSLFSRYHDEVFKYYNESIEHTAKITSCGKGYNKYCPTIYPIANLFDRADKDIRISRVLSLDRDLLSKTGKPIRKRFVERAYSIDTGISRVGNENLELLYCSIYSSRGNCLDEIIQKSFYNMRVGVRYNKSIPTIPIWSMDRKPLSETLKRELYALVGTSEIPMVDSIISSDEKVIDSINNNNGFIEINKKLSKILIATTRTESYKVIEAKKYADLLINKIAKEYQEIFATVLVEPTIQDSRERKRKVKDIIGSIFND
jgi:hypothetical protein